VDAVHYAPLRHLTNRKVPEGASWISDGAYWNRLGLPLPAPAKQTYCTEAGGEEWEGNHLSRDLIAGS
jgi:hypothetical protein